MKCLPVNVPKGQKVAVTRGKQKPKNEERKKLGFSDFKSYKEAVNTNSRAEPDKPDSDCWVDSEPSYGAANSRRKDRADRDRVKEGNDDADREQRQDGGQRGRGARGRGRARGKGGFIYTAEEKSDKDKLKAGREINNRKRGGHHNQKDRAAKKRQF